MFISEPLIFVELHKTGGSHIGRCLRTILDGHQQGKHNIVPANLHHRFILGSIRNPWDWYVSLWGFGCDGNGSVYHRTTRRFDVNYYWRQINKEMGANWLSPGQYGRQFLADVNKPVSLWRASYKDSADPEGFRAWLKMILNPARRFDIGEGFGFSPLAQRNGLLTYRYFKLFTNLGGKLYQNSTLSNGITLSDLWTTHNITNFIIRNESLEEDLIEALRYANVPLTDDNIALIEQGKVKKTNTSTRKETGFYYDQETIQLVQDRESFIIEQYGYTPPPLSGSGIR